MLAEHGTVPKVGVRVEVHGHQLTVEDVQGRKITRVRIRAAGTPEGQATAP